MIQQIYIKIQANIMCNLGKTTSFNIESLDDTKTFAEQLQYFRKINNIRIKNMARELKIGYNTIVRLESAIDNEFILTHKRVQTINIIIDYLNIRDIINYNNDEYIDFVLNKQAEYIKILLNKYKRYQLAQILDVVPDTITRWINGSNVVSHNNYYKIKKMLEN